MSKSPVKIHRDGTLEATKLTGFLTDTEKQVVSGSDKPVTAGGVFLSLYEISTSLQNLSSSLVEVILDNEETTAAALNDLADRQTSLSGSLQGLSASIDETRQPKGNYLVASDLEGLATTGSVDAVNRRLDTLVSGSASTAIDTFNEIVSFLNNIQDTETLDGIVAGINQSISASANAVRSEVSASYATSASVASAMDSVRVTVDTNMSDSSTNPVQNSTVKAYIDSALGDIDTILTSIIGE